MEKRTMGVSVGKGILYLLPKDPGSVLIRVFWHMLLCCMLSAGGSAG